MTYRCKLGFDNSDGEGGEYKGKGIAKFYLSLLLTAQKDQRVKEPGINAHIKKEKVLISPNFDIGIAAVHGVHLSDDDSYKEISCCGFEWDDAPTPDEYDPQNCKGCPFLEEGDGD